MMKKLLRYKPGDIVKINHLIFPDKIKSKRLVVLWYNYNRRKNNYTCTTQSEYIRNSINKRPRNNLKFYSDIDYLNIVSYTCKKIELFEEEIDYVRRGKKTIFEYPSSISNIN